MITYCIKALHRSSTRQFIGLATTGNLLVQQTILLPLTNIKNGFANDAQMSLETSTN